jgi:hypothetical protein
MAMTVKHIMFWDDIPHTKAEVYYVPDELLPVFRVS